MTALDGLQLYPVWVPMRHRFRRVDHREAVLIEGPAGWGEFSPFPEYPPTTTARWLASALESACSTLPDPLRHRVPVNVTVPAVDPVTAAALVAASGCGTAKVKVAERGQTEADDLARVEAVRSALGDSGLIRIDANAAWDVETAIVRIEKLARFGLEYAEQPVATIEELRRVRQSVHVPIAADESVRASGGDPLAVVEAEAADVIVVKVQPLGGVASTLDLARRAGVPVVVSSALETSVGMYAGVLAAATMPGPGPASGLGTVSLLAGDVVLDRLEPRRGYVDVRRPAPDLELVARHRPDEERSAAMLGRVRAAAEVLG